MFNPFTRGEFLTFAKDFLGTTAVASRLKLSERLGEHMRSRIFTDSEIRNLELEHSYSDLGSFQLKNNIGVDGNASNFCELVGITDRELQGSYIAWIAEQKHLQPDVSIENRSFPHREMVYLNSPTAGRRIAYTDGGRVLVREVSEIFPHIEDYDDITIYAGGVIVHSFNSDGFDGVVWEIAQYKDGDFKIIDTENRYDDPLPAEPELLDGSYEVSGHRIDKSAKLEDTKELIYFPSCSNNLVKIEGDAKYRQMSVVGGDNYPSVILADSFNLHFIDEIEVTSEAKLFQFRDYLGDFAVEQIASDVQPKLKYLVTNGNFTESIELDIDYESMMQRRMSIDYSSNLTEIEQVAEFGNYRDFLPIGMVMFRENNSDGFTSLPFPWILIGVNNKGRVVLRQTKTAKEYFQQSPIQEFPVYPNMDEKVLT